MIFSSLSSTMWESNMTEGVLMSKKIAIISLSAVLASQLMGAEDLAEMIKEGKAGGYIRMHHIEPGFSDTIAASGSVIGGKLKYQTGALYGLRFGAAFYTTHDTGLTKWDYSTREGRNQLATGLFGDEWGSYSTLGEAYASYHISNTDLTYGRQEFQTPMTKNAVTIIPNLFEGTVATIKELPDTKITAAHITKIQYGTRSTTDQGLIGDGLYGITAGAGAGLKAPTGNADTGAITAGYGKEYFQDMAEAAFGRNVMDTSGVTSLGIEYAKGNLKANAWDYYAHEIMNTIYADAEYKLNAGVTKVTLGAQLLTQSDVGNFANSAGGAYLSTASNFTAKDITGTNLYRTQLSPDGQIDATLWGVQAKAEFADLAVSLAYNQTNDGHIINPWGGDPAYTSTIFSRNEYRADTNAYKIGAEYDFGSLGIRGLKFMVNHASYDTDVKKSHSWNGAAWVADTSTHTEKSDEQDYVLHYAVPSVKGLWFRLFHVERDNDTKNYEQSHTRLIVNLGF